MSEAERKEIGAQARFWKREIFKCLELAEKTAECPVTWRRHWEAAKVARLRYIREVTERLDEIADRKEEGP